MVSIVVGTNILDIPFSGLSIDPRYCPFSAISQAICKTEAVTALVGGEVFTVKHENIVVPVFDSFYLGHPVRQFDFILCCVGSNISQSASTCLRSHYRTICRVINNNGIPVTRKLGQLSSVALFQRRIIGILSGVRKLYFAIQFIECQRLILCVARCVLIRTEIGRTNILTAVIVINAHISRVPTSILTLQITAGIIKRPSRYRGTISHTQTIIIINTIKPSFSDSGGINIVSAVNFHNIPPLSAIIRHTRVPN